MHINVYIYIGKPYILLHSIYNIFFHFFLSLLFPSTPFSFLLLLFIYSKPNDLKSDEDRKSLKLSSASQVPSAVWQIECMQYSIFSPLMNEWRNEWCFSCLWSNCFLMSSEIHALPVLPLLPT